MYLFAGHNSDKTQSQNEALRSRSSLGASLGNTAFCGGRVLILQPTLSSYLSPLPLPLPFLIKTSEFVLWDKRKMRVLPNLVLPLLI